MAIYNVIFLWGINDINHITADWNCEQIKVIQHHKLSSNFYGICGIGWEVRDSFVPTEKRGNWQLDHSLIKLYNLCSYSSGFLIPVSPTHTHNHIHTTRAIKLYRKGGNRGGADMILIWSSFKQIRAFLMPSFEVKRPTLIFGNFPKQTQIWKLLQLNRLCEKDRLVCHIRMKACGSLLCNLTQRQGRSQDFRCAEVISSRPPWHPHTLV